MLPVVNLDSVRVAWVKIQGAGYVLYGFLLYTAADRAIWSFLNNGGMIELDWLSGPRCAIFVLGRPPKDFVEYAEREKPAHPWIKIFRQGAREKMPPGAQDEAEPGAQFDLTGKRKKPWQRWAEIFLQAMRGKEGRGTDEDAKTSAEISETEIRNIDRAVVVVGVGNEVQVGALFEGPAIDLKSVQSVLDNFALKRTDLPCLVWFEDIQDRRYQLLDLRYHTDHDALLHFFREYFDSKDFKTLIEQASIRHAA